MATLEKMESESEKFKSKFEDILFPIINEKLNVDLKVEISLYEINELLKENFIAQYLYQKIKNHLSYSELKVSIRKDPKNSIFVFFKKTDKVNRESDIFKVNVEYMINSPEFIEALNKYSVIKFTDLNVKETFNCKYNSNTIYLKFKEFLGKTNIDVSILRNQLNEGKYVDIFKFYYKKDIDTVKKEERRIEEERKKHVEELEEIEKDNKEVVEYFKESDEKDKQEKEKIKSKIIEEGANIIKNYIIPDINTYKCNVCEKGILKEPELICPICRNKVLEKWE